MAAPVRPSFRIRRGRRRAWAALAVAAIGVAGLAGPWAGPATAAPPGVVQTTDGRSFAGEITESPGEVEVVRGGIRTVLPRDQVSGIEYGTFAERYARRLEALPADDAANRVALAREALDEREYDLAERALLQAQSIRPEDPDTEALLTTVRSQRRVPTGAAPPDDEDDADAAAPPAAPPNAPPERRYLDEAQVNRIRQAELTPDDRAVRVRIDDELARTYVESTGMDFRDFRRLSPADQATRVLAGADDEARAKVVVTNDPAPLQEYRRRVQPIILSGCASAGCHGGQSAGDFILFNDAAEPAAYTNFYILSRYEAQVEGEVDGGIFGGPAARQMIERGNAGTSLLLQYGLPLKTAQNPHPAAGNYNGIFRGPTDPAYRTIADWMNRSLKSVEPDYGIDYQPPTPAGGDAGDDDTEGEGGEEAVEPTPAVPQPSVPQR